MNNLQLTELEIKMAFLERHVEAQDRAMHALNLEIAQLKRDLERLTERMEAGSDSSGAPPAHEKPPHY